MTRILRAATLLVAASAVLSAAPAHAGDDAHPAKPKATSAAAAPVKVVEPWVREAPPQAAAMAAYMVLENAAGQDLQLVGLTSPQFQRVEMHEIVTEDGMAKMVEVKSLAVPAGGALKFEPGATHVMLIGPKKPLPAGSRVDLTLRFSNGATMPIRTAVRPRDGKAAGEHEHHHHH